MMNYTPLDTKLAGSVVLIVGGVPIKFQFPPRITSDNRKGNWSEDNIPGSEPVATYEHSGPRIITLTWTYIVEGNGSWSTNAIANQVRAIRGYFGRARDAGDYRNLLVRFKMWQLTGGETMTCRLTSVDVKHSDTIVAPFCGVVSDAYHLRTDVTADIRIWTKSGRGSEIVQDVDGIAIEESPQWY